MLHLDSWIKIDQLDVTCFIISLFNAQHVSNVSTSILRSLRLIVDLFHVLYCSGSMCVGVTVWFGWGGVLSLCTLKLCFSLHKDTQYISLYVQSSDTDKCRITIFFILSLCTFETSWRWRQQILPKCLDHSTKLHGATSQKNRDLDVHFCESLK